MSFFFGGGGCQRGQTRRKTGANCCAKWKKKRVLLDAFSRRHEAQKIYLRQAAAQRWIEYREEILQGGRPSSGNQAQLRRCDQQLRTVCFTLSFLPSVPPPPPFFCYFTLQSRFVMGLVFFFWFVFADLRYGGICRNCKVSRMRLSTRSSRSPIKR